MTPSVTKYFEELPHREAIDRACCNFARLYGDTELIRPLVSDTWDGHGKLRDGIARRAADEDWRFSSQVSSGYDGNHTASVFAASDQFGIRRGFGTSDSLPKAFALAVVELARQFEAGT